MEDNLATMLSDAARQIRRSFDARARGIGVTRPQWQVLVALRRNEGINQGGLAEVLEVEPITVCRMVDRLQDADLVERRPDPTDRRSWRLFLTPKGDGLIDQLRPLGEALMTEAFDGLTPQECEQLAGMLDRIRANLAKKPAESQVANG